MVSQSRRQNYAIAQNNLGACYSNSEGVTRDWKEAARWFRKAAEQDNAPAQYNLGNCYIRGAGVADDLVEAYKWELLAARRGDEDARKLMTWLEKNAFLKLEQIAQGQKRPQDFKPR
jgi:uncharacterized protein